MFFFENENKITRKNIYEWTKKIISYVSKTENEQMGIGKNERCRSEGCFAVNAAEAIKKVYEMNESGKSKAKNKKKSEREDIPKKRMCSELKVS